MDRGDAVREPTSLLTFISEDTEDILGIYASERDLAAHAFEETGRIVEGFRSGYTRLWLRVAMSDHSTCLFTGNLRRVEMEGSYLCFREGISFERGRWAVWRSY